MTLFNQIEETENCHFGRIWKPKPPRRQKNEKNTPLKAGKKKEKKRAKRYPLKADFAVLLFFDCPNRNSLATRNGTPTHISADNKKNSPKMQTIFYRYFIYHKLQTCGSGERGEWGGQTCGSGGLFFLFPQ